MHHAYITKLQYGSFIITKILKKRKKLKFGFKSKVWSTTKEKEKEKHFETTPSHN